MPVSGRPTKLPLLKITQGCCGLVDEAIPEKLIVREEQLVRRQTADACALR